MLGTLRLLVDGQTTTHFRTRKTAALLAFLAFHQGRPHRREHVAEMLWPDKSEQPARHSLSMELSALRKLLSADCLLCSTQTIELSGVETDVSEFERFLVASEALQDVPAVESLEKAWALYGGPLMPGHDEQWIIGQQNRLDALFTACCERLSALKQGLFTSGEIAAKWIFVSPFDEGTRIASVSAQPRDDLPLMRSTVIGRQEECAEVRRLLVAGRQLVTILGPGGVGKTTVALSVIEALREDDWEVVIVRGAQLKRGESILASACQGLGLMTLGTTPAEQLARSLAPGSILYLDNMEHLTEHSGPEIDELLHKRPDLQILVTSRRPLGLTGEVEIRIPPLSVPRGSMSTAEILLAPSVQLFLERCGGRSDELVQAAGKLCTRLEGLPLAIELAAAAAMSHLAQHISQLAGHNMSTEQVRPTSLAGVVQWSLALLDPQERLLLGSLSFFKTSFCVEDARLLGYESAEKAVAKLHADSLIQERTGGLVPRYRMLEPIRETVPALLDPVELSLSRARFLDAMRIKAERARNGLFGPNQPTVLRELVRDAPQFQSALDLCEEDGQWELACTLLCDLKRYWLVRHQFEMPLARIRTVISNLVEPGHLAKSHFLEGRLLRKLQRLSEAEEAFWKGLEYARESNQPLEEAGCLYGLGLLLHVARKNVKGLTYALKSLTLFRALQNPEGIMLSAKLASYIYNELDDRPTAAKHLEEAEVAMREAQDLWGELQVTLAIGSFDRHGARGRAALERTLELATILGDRMSAAQSAGNLAGHFSLFGPHDKAFERFDAAEQIYRAGGDWLSVAHIIVSRALLVRRQGSAAEALELLDKAEQISTLQEGPGLWRSRQLRARCLLEIGQHAEAIVEYEALLGDMPAEVTMSTASRHELAFVIALINQDAAAIARTYESLASLDQPLSNGLAMADLARMAVRSGLLDFDSDLTSALLTRARDIEDAFGAPRYVCL